jgi:membrane protein DedA with SNARE-associated domain
MEPLALAGIVALLLVKEAGLPIPVPGDLVVVGTAAALATDAPGALLALALILIAGYLGGMVQFALVRGTVRRPLLRTLARFGVPEERIDALAAWIRRTGARGVAISRMTPGVRVGSIAASGIAGLPLPTFVRGLVAGNTVFVSGHFALGFVLGASASSLIAQASGIALPVVGVIILAALGAVGWLLIRRRRAGASPVAAWIEAACPACLTLGAIGIQPAAFERR